MMGKDLLTPGPEKPLCFTVSGLGAWSSTQGDRPCVSKSPLRTRGSVSPRVPPMRAVPIKGLASSAVPLKASPARSWLFKDYQMGAAELKPQPLSSVTLYIMRCQLHNARSLMPASSCM